MAAIAVARYTLLELSRRRLLLVFAGIAVLLTAGLGLAPLFLPGMSSADDRAVFPALYLADQLSRIPGASGSGDAVYWLAYLLVVCAILYVALRRKQV
jgi:hypothetical protein